MGTFLDDFLEIDAIIGVIIFFMGLQITFCHFTSSERESAFLEPLLKKKQELGGPRFINKVCSLCKRLLGTSGMMQVKSKLRGS
jgi:hypothetical protein